MYKMDRLALFLYTKYKLDVCQKYLGEAFLVQHVHHHHLAIDDRRADGTTAKFPAQNEKKLQVMKARSSSCNVKKIQTSSVWVWAAFWASGVQQRQRRPSPR
jgi:hypothetical protein